jgi:hypothetical protein
MVFGGGGGRVVVSVVWWCLFGGLDSVMAEEGVGDGGRREEAGSDSRIGEAAFEWGRRVLWS